MRQKLEAWPQPFVRCYILKQIIQKKGQAYYSAVKQALKEGSLVLIRRGLYQIDGRRISKFELAHELHAPSFISLESALSYHGWIPESVQTTTSACLKRSVDISTPLGCFSYTPVPLDEFYTGVERVKNDVIFLIATPWRAVADLIYSQKRTWKNLLGFSEDLRIELSDLWASDLTTLEELATHYPNNRVQKTLSLLLKQLKG